MPRILVIDDDQAIRELLRAVLEAEGHEVTDAPDGNKGIEIYRDQPADVIVTDMIMPEKPGWETILELKREFPDLKAIGISAGAQQGPFGYLRLAKRFGAKRILTKPVKRKELLAAIEDVLAGREELQSRGQGTIPRAREKKSVLVVDRDKEHMWTLCEGLTRAGHSVTDIPDPGYALEMMKQKSFHVAILDVNSTRYGETDLIELLRSSWTHPLIIAMADFSALAVKKSVITRGANHFVSKPVDLLELLEMICPPPAFSSQLDGFDILEYVQFILLTGKQTLVEARSRQGESCRLYCSEGSIIHAQSDANSGEDAFFRCMAFQGGSLRNLPWEEPPFRTIRKPGDFLLMEAARRRDDNLL